MIITIALAILSLAGIMAGLLLMGALGEKIRASRTDYEHRAKVVAKRNKATAGCSSVTQEWLGGLE